MSTIFDRLVRNENGHSGLLCAIMDRDPKVASIVLSLMTSDQISETEADRLSYRTQASFQDEHGRDIPDISVKGKALECIIEAKIDPDLGLTARQLRGYAGCFGTGDAHKYLCFVAPLRWKKRSDVDAVKVSLRSKKVAVRVLYWTDLVHAVAGQIPDDQRGELLREVVKFWQWAFEVEPMQQGEITFLLSWSGENYKAIRKLERTVDQIRAIFDSKGIPTEKETADITCMGSISSGTKDMFSGLEFGRMVRHLSASATKFINQVGSSLLDRKGAK